MSCGSFHLRGHVVPHVVSDRTNMLHLYSTKGFFHLFLAPDAGSSDLTWICWRPKLAVLRDVFEMPWGSSSSSPSSPQSSR